MTVWETGKENSSNALTFYEGKLLYIMSIQKGSAAVNDDKLIRMIKSGNMEALDALIQKHYDGIYTYCYRKMGNRHDAQDITQEVFLHFCRNFNAYTQMGKCRNYLYTIAHNLCINTAQKKIPIPSEDIERGNPAIPDVPAERFEAAEAIRTALNELPEEQKEVILLRFYHDLKLKEIAGIMNSKLSVTKYRLSQAIKTLSKLLSKEDLL